MTERIASATIIINNTGRRMLQTFSMPPLTPFITTNVVMPIITASHQMTCTGSVIKVPNTPPTWSALMPVNVPAIDLNRYATVQPAIPP